VGHHGVAQLGEQRERHVLVRAQHLERGPHPGAWRGGALQHRDRRAREPEEVEAERDDPPLGVRAGGGPRVVDGADGELVPAARLLDDLRERRVRALLAAADPDEPAAAVPLDDDLDREVGIDHAQRRELLRHDGQASGVGPEVLGERVGDRRSRRLGPLVRVGGELGHAVERGEEGRDVGGGGRGAVVVRHAGTLGPRTDPRENTPHAFAGG
jgi:hypothetical protein